MYARVARWEGVEPERMRAGAQEIERSEGPPPGVPAKGVLVLNDESSGRSLTITLFETEEDMQQGNETLNGMNPSSEGAGSRTTVEMYELAVERRLD